MNDLVTKSQTHRALNQLTALIVGAKFARETKNYEKDPRERLNHCYKAIMKAVSYTHLTLPTIYSV